LLKKFQIRGGNIRGIPMNLNSTNLATNPFADNQLQSYAYERVKLDDNGTSITLNNSLMQKINSENNGYMGRNPKNSINNTAVLTTFGQDSSNVPH
jgi:hypothetical protein